MVALIVWAAVIAHLAIGMVIGRKIFVRVLGTAPRIKGDSLYHTWSEEYNSAFWWAMFSIPLWPITIALRKMFAETAYEKSKRQAVEFKNAEAEFKRLERRLDLDFFDRK